MIGDSAMIARLFIAAGLGAAIGIEREFRDQPAGLRTHILVATGSCLFTLVSAFGFKEIVRPGTADYTRIASQVVVGIGFLGGGTILRHGATVRGLTTAASLWITAATGLAVGAGFALGAVVTAGIAIFSLTVLKPLEKRLFPRLRQEDDPPSGLPPS